MMRGVRGASLTVLFTGVALAQSASPSLEVASVKKHLEQSIRSRSSVSGSRVTVVALDLYDLILEAYNLKDYQLSGAAGWMGGGANLSDIVANEKGAEFYDISAKAEGDTPLTRDQGRLILQMVLADRFHLMIHRETKDLPVYALTVGKNGLKLKESAADTKFSAGQELGSLAKMTDRKTTMTQFAGFLSVYTDRPIVDRTGLTGVYDFTLEWSLNDTQDSAAPSIFTAVQEQLGLKLEPSRAPVEVLVIDYAEKPSEN